MQEREVEEAIERIRYRKQLDEKSDREKEKIADFYKDVSNFQVILFFSVFRYSHILIRVKQLQSMTHICLRNTKWMLRR